jgi:ferric-dicitrate binding protein FerR (iron transport regulator)
MSEEYVQELIEKYARGIATEDEIRALREWYRSAPVSEVPWPADSPGEGAKLHKRMLDRLHQQIGKKEPATLYTPWIRAAAIFLVVVGAAALTLWIARRFSSPYLTLVNTFGTVRDAYLPDSSRVWLNAATTLRYPRHFIRDRRVQLQGEAFFEVRHDPTHPFRVITGDVTTTVRGTSFNVKGYREDGITSVKVLTGRVMVSHKEDRLAVLQPGMQLSFEKESKIVTTSAVDTATLANWRRGRLQFEGEPLSTIAHTVERWYGVKVQFRDAALMNCRYYMGFDNTLRLEELLSTMAVVTGMHYQIDTDKKTVTLSGKGCP